MIWAAVVTVLTAWLWCGRFWIAYVLARLLRRLARGRDGLVARRWSRRLSRYAAK